jgi:hypothetical protein
MGMTGPTGSIGVTGDCWSSYLYWDTTISGGSWQVDGSEVHIGCDAGLTGQQPYAVAVGAMAGMTDQSGCAVAVGYRAGEYQQDFGAIAIGHAAGLTGQNDYAVAIGYKCGVVNQGINSVAIGIGAGSNNQGNNSVAVGNGAGNSLQHDNTIILNATGIVLDTGAVGATYIAPIRDANDAIPGATGPTGPVGPVKYPGDYLMAYDPSQTLCNASAEGTKEVVYGRHGMLLATYYLPFRWQSEQPDISEIWCPISAQGISQSLSKTPFIDTSGNLSYCQKNNYNYFIVDCSNLSPINIVLNKPDTCRRYIQTNAYRECTGIIALVHDPDQNYCEAAHLTLHWGTNLSFNEPCSIRNFQSTWTASIEWLNDPRSVYQQNPEWRIMLLGANHSY